MLKSLIISVAALAAVPAVTFQTGTSAQTVQPTIPMSQFYLFATLTGPEGSGAAKYMETKTVDGLSQALAVSVKAPAGKVLLVAVDGIVVGKVVVDKWGRGYLELRTDMDGGVKLPRPHAGSKITVGFIAGVFKQA
jgi:hypothetical protein